MISIITVLCPIFICFIYSTTHTVIQNETNVDLFWKCGVHFYWKKIIYIDVYFLLQGKKLAKYGSIKLQIQTLINGILDMGSDCKKLNKIK